MSVGYPGLNRLMGNQYFQVRNSSSHPDPLRVDLTEGSPAGVGVPESGAGLEPLSSGSDKG